MKSAPKSSINRWQKIFGVLGYLSLMMLWLWAAILLIPPLLKVPPVNDLVIPQSDQRASRFEAPSEVPPAIVGIAVGFSAIIVIVGMIMAARAPKTLSVMTSRTIHRTASTAAKRMYRPTSTPEKTVFQLSERLVWYCKLGLITVGYGLCLLAAWLTNDLHPQIIVVIASYLAIWPFVWFGVQRLATQKGQSAF